MASENAKKAAEKMAEMAQKMAKKLPSKHRPKDAPAMQGGNARGKNMPFNYEPESFETGAPDAEWARIKGKASAGSLVDELQNIPPEYRDLVRRYFVELAREGKSGVRGTE